EACPEAVGEHVGATASGGQQSHAHCHSQTTASHTSGSHASGSADKPSAQSCLATADACRAEARSECEDSALPGSPQYSNSAEHDCAICFQLSQSAAPSFATARLAAT